MTATLALVVALGGTSYAALKLPKNSVGGREIKRGAVGSSEVRNGSLRGIDIKESSLSAVPEARHAKGADRSATAGNADNADTLGGLTAGQLKVQCPPGTSGVGPGCVELALRSPQNLVGATAACGNVGGRLPLANEAPGAAGGELSASLTGPSTVLVKPASGPLQEVSTDEAHPFRCILTPRN